MRKFRGCKYRIKTADCLLPYEDNPYGNYDAKKTKLDSPKDRILERAYWWRRIR
jgi:hypothetical protein